MTKKKVTAPLTYDPGKGRPKEHLAYLNYQEMQALKRLNGNNMEMGPRGLPSFPPADAIGSSSRTPTRSSGPGGGSLSAPVRTAPSSGGGSSSVSRISGGTAGSNMGSYRSSTGGSSSVSRISGGTAGSNMGSYKSSSPGMGSYKSSDSGMRAPAASAAAARNNMGAARASTQGAAPRSISGIGSPADRAIKQAVESKNARDAIRTPALKEDRSKTIGAGLSGAFPGMGPQQGSRIKGAIQAVKDLGVAGVPGGPTRVGVPAATVKIQTPRQFPSIPSGAAAGMSMLQPGKNIPQTQSAIGNYVKSYEMAKLVKEAYPNIKDSVDKLASMYNNLSVAMPGEAYVDKYGPEGIRDLTRVATNMLVRNQTADQVLSFMDTLGIRPGTEKFRLGEAAGGEGMGVVPTGSDYQNIAISEMEKGIRGIGVSPQAMNASNFWAAGTKPPSGPSGSIPAIGEPVRGTQFGIDPVAEKAIANRNKEAEQILNSYNVSPTIQQNKGAISSSAAEEMVRRAFAEKQLGNLWKDPVIHQGLKNALSQSMWDTRILDATRTALGKKPIGAFGELSPAPELSGFRTLQEQKGISGKYTKVKSPERSYHTWGLAVDVLPERLAGETPREYDIRVGEVNREIAKNITDPAVKWGGTFNRFVDPAHFQYGSGGALKSAKKYESKISEAGIRPPSMDVRIEPAGGPPPKPRPKPEDLMDAYKRKEIYDRIPEGKTIYDRIPEGELPKAPVIGRGIESLYEPMPEGEVSPFRDQRITAGLERAPYEVQRGIVGGGMSFTPPVSSKIYTDRIPSEPERSPVIDPRVGLPVGGYPRAGLSSIVSDPRVGLPSGAFPAQRPSSIFAEDPRLGLGIGSFPPARPPSFFTEDPRLGVPQGAFPAARPPSFFAEDPRVGLPLGALPEAEKVLQVETVPPEREYDVLSGIRVPVQAAQTEQSAVVKELGGTKINVDGKTKTISDIVDDYVQPEESREAIEKIAGLVASGKTEFTPQEIYDIVQEVRRKAAETETEVVTEDGQGKTSPHPGQGTTERQDEIIDNVLDRVKNAQRAGTAVAGIATGIPAGLIAGRVTDRYIKNVKDRLNRYAAMNDAEKAAAEKRDPALIGWGRLVGIPSVGDYKDYQDWAEKSGLTFQGGREGGGGIRDIVMGPTEYAQAPTTPTTPSEPKPEKSGPRPEIYYMWDLGIRIPSPGDPNYTQYQKYLIDTAAAQKAMGWA